MSSCRQWNMGSDVNSSAKIQPIAQISEERAGRVSDDGPTMSQDIVQSNGGSLLVHQCKHSNTKREMLKHTHTHLTDGFGTVFE